MKRKRPTLAEVARVAGVSVGTASRVLREVPGTRVSDSTRQRIFRTADWLDYQANPAGRALRTSKTGVIGLVVPDLRNVDQLLMGVEKEAKNQGWTVFLARIREGEDDISRVKEIFRGGYVDGLLIQSQESDPMRWAAAFTAGEHPLVFVNSINDGEFGTVSLDDVSGMSNITKYLLSKGHRRIAFIGGDRASASSPRRLEGYVSAMERHGVGVLTKLIVETGYTSDAGRLGMRALYESGHEFTALAVANVNSAIGALGEAHRLGLRVPEKVSFAAFNDSWAAANTWPPLTTLMMPMARVGSQAVQMLSRHLRDGFVEHQIVDDVSPVLIERESVVSFVRDSFRSESPVQCHTQQESRILEEKNV